MSTPLPYPQSQRWQELTALGDEYSEEVRIPNGLILINQVVDGQQGVPLNHAVVMVVDAQVLAQCKHRHWSYMHIGGASCRKHR